MSEEEIKAAAVRVMREHLEVSEKTRVNTSIATTTALVLAIVGATWALAGVLHDIRDGQTRVEEGMGYKMNVAQFRAWTFALDRANRTIDPARGLNVPEVPDAILLPAGR